MKLDRHEDPLGARLLQAFEQLQLFYGGDTYSSLVCPASLEVSSSEVHGIQDDLAAVDALFREATELYIESLNDPQLAWVREMAEAGLAPVERNLSRHVALRRYVPIQTRVDYVALQGRDRSIAEVQWKSGGPGFFLGHLVAYSAVLGAPPAFGDPARNFLGPLANACSGQNGCIVNEVRSQWLGSEQWLTEQASEDGIDYRAFDRSDLGKQFHLSADGLRVWSDATPIPVLRGRGYSGLLDATTLVGLQRAVDAGRLWLEAPLNYIYRAKWPLAMRAVSDVVAVRQAMASLPPAMLIANVSGAVRLFNSPDERWGADLAGVSTLEEILRLPASVRGRLVVKYGGSVGSMLTGGRGVWRLSGSRGQAKRTLSMVESSVLRGEPWVVQLDVGDTMTAPLAPPWEPSKPTDTQSHIRVMAFGSRHNAEWHLDAVVGNFGHRWKVGGATAKLSTSGQIEGTAFTELRVVESV
jgi:hypothetical protein